MTAETGTFTPTDEDAAAARAAIREQSLDRFANEFLAPDARDWLAGFAARAALAAIGPIIERERRAEATRLVARMERAAEDARALAEARAIDPDRPGYQRLLGQYEGMRAALAIGRPGHQMGTSPV